MSILGFVVAGVVAGVFSELSKLLFERYFKSPTERHLERIEQTLKERLP